ncbi:MAG: pyruvate, phosphate dikinase [Pseudonocardia sp.]|nr:pyruvate, phosphate dikinase [Pseudonocardia sp.]
MRWVRTIGAQTDDPPETLGGKAHGLVAAHRLGLPVPDAFVVTTEACREFRRTGRLPEGLLAEVTSAVGVLESATGRTFGGSTAPLAVSVRSGAATSMPGMMSTILNLGLTTTATAALARETGDTPFARGARLGFLTSAASAFTGATAAPTAEAPGGAPLADAIRAAETFLAQRLGGPVPDDAAGQLVWALRTVFSSWDAPRARTYRDLHDIPHDLGTAVIVQVTVFGNRDERSGTGVAFSRDPNTGEPVPFGDVAFERQGDDVVSGRSATRPLGELADREPAVWAGLVDALDRVERRLRDACYVEFTYESGRLWILQVRPGRFVGRAALRVAVDLADEGLLGRREALRRVTPRDLEHARTPRIAASDDDIVLGRGVGACPGVVSGRVATSSDSATRLASGGPVVLVRPETSPLDMRGLAAAGGVVTARGGPASHAAVVARAMGKPAVVGAGGLTVDATDGSVTAAGRTVADGTVITIDGTGGEIVLGRPRTVTGDVDRHRDRLLSWADDASGDHSERSGTQRLRDAHTALHTTEEQ